MRLVQLFAVLLLTSLYSIASYAIDYIDCGQSQTSILARGNTNEKVVIERRGSGWGAKFQTIYDAPYHGDCRNYLDDTSREQWGGYLVEGWYSYIDHSRTLSHNGQTYYGLTGTSSSFLNQHAYIYFKVQHGYQPSYTIEQAHNGSLFFHQQRDISYAGVRLLDLDMYFTAEPKETFPVDLSLGALYYVIAKDNFQHYAPGGNARRGAMVWLTVTLEPPQAKTCDVGSTTIVLPTISTSAFNYSLEIGQTFFDINVNCGSGVIGKNLVYQIIDTNNPGGQEHYLKNMESETSNNVAIGLQQYSNTGAYVRRIVFGDAFTYDLGQSFNGTPIQVKFKASYTKLDATIPVNAGKVNGQASLLVTYR